MELAGEKVQQGRRARDAAEVEVLAKTGHRACKEAKIIGGERLLFDLIGEFLTATDLRN
jgi:hypothetical protein